MEKGFSPVGLRVLVVDDDPTWLKILEKMLKKCYYEVTTCGLAREALKLLRERKDGYDIVISDVNMPDMDGFKLLEHVGLEMDLPVIMMSVDGETSRVMKGVQHGACDYLLKPIRMKELKIIWQHVLRKKLQEVRDFESFEGSESMWISRYGLDQCEESHFHGVEELSFGRKRKDMDKKHQEDSDPCSTKKARVVWTYELHHKFVKAVNQIGCDHKAGPKKILDLMNVPWLTRENVASHLQKYRLYLSRLEKENEQNKSPSPKDHGEILSSSSTIPPPDLPNPNSTRVESKGISSTTLSESKHIDVVGPQKAKKTRIGFDQSFESGFLQQPLTNQSYGAEDDSVTKIKACFESPVSSCQSQVAPVSCVPCLMETEMKPCFESSASSCLSQVAPVSRDEFLLPQGNSSSETLHELAAPSTISGSYQTEETNLNWQLPESELHASMENHPHLSWLQGNCFQNIEFTDYNNSLSSSSLFTEFPFHHYDATRFGYELLPDPDEYYSLVDQGLFIA